MVERTPEAARQLASRARRRVRGAAPSAPRVTAPGSARSPRPSRQPRARGTSSACVAVLHPEVVLRVDLGAGRALHVTRGAEAVASQAILFRSSAPASDRTETVLVNGSPGLMQVRGGRPFSVVAFTIAGDRIVGMDIIADPERLARLGLG